MQNVVRTEAYYEVFEQIVAVVHSSTNVREVLDIIVWKVSEILQAKGAVLRILNPEKNELELGAAYGLNEQYLSKGPVSSSKTIMELYEKDRVFIIDDIWKDPRVQYPQEAWDEGITTILDLPVTMQEHLIGIIRIFFSEEKKFSPEDLNFLVAITRQCACAIDRARAFEEQKNRYDQLIVQTEKLSALGRMAAGIAHEINNPLSGILLYSSNMRKKVKDDGPLREGLDIIVQETIRCRGIIQDLLEFSREKEPHRVMAHMNGTIEKVLALLENTFYFHHIILEKDLCQDIPECLMDPNQIHQVFLNLLLNAVEAIRENGIITVRTHVDSDNNNIVATVEDTGCGISLEDLPRIFEPFYSTKSKGTGLGLAVTYGIIKNHEGELKVFSRQEQGTQFVVEIPILLEKIAS
ncbi:MAG: ATP-binding protein [Syntrophobacteraceae bacterium]